MDYQYNVTYCMNTGVLNVNLGFSQIYLAIFQRMFLNVKSDAVIGPCQGFSNDVIQDQLCRTALRPTLKI